MRLTTENLARFIGGQMEIQNQEEEYLYRGEIKTITVENNEVRVKFAWCAKGEGFPPMPTHWVKNENLEYAASLEIFAVNNIGPSDHGVGGGDRICLNSPIVGELAVLYPSDGSKLDPAKVEGLKLATA